MDMNEDELWENFIHALCMEAKKAFDLSGMTGGELGTAVHDMEHGGEKIFSSAFLPALAMIVARDQFHYREQATFMIRVGFEPPAALDAIVNSVGEEYARKEGAMPNIPARVRTTFGMWAREIRVDVPRQLVGHEDRTF